MIRNFQTEIPALVARKLLFFVCTVFDILSTYLLLLAVSIEYRYCNIPPACPIDFLFMGRENQTERRTD